MKTAYIAGGMRGHALYNHPAFFAAADALREDGWEVVNPAQMDLDAGYDPYKLSEDHDWSQVPEDFDLDATIRKDILAILDCDAIYMLDGWMGSLGAIAERGVAMWAGKAIMYQTPFVSGEVQKAAVSAIFEAMHYDGLTKHPIGKWKQEPQDNHLDKACRHMLTYRLIRDGNSPEDGEPHLRNAVCRAAMAYAQTQQNDGEH